MKQGQPIPIEPSEFDELNSAIEAELGTKGGSTFSDLLNRYAVFVGSLDGYPFTIYDYDNDVSVRETLELALSRCSPSTRSKAAKALEALDTEFIGNTIAMKRPRLNHAASESLRWYGRVPKSPGKEMADDIARGRL